MSYSKIYNYKDFLSFLQGSGYADAAKKKKEQQTAALNSQLKDFENQKKQVSAEAEDLARQAYISYISSAKDLPEQLSAKGMTGGAADNVYLSLVNEYQNNYNDISKQKSSRLSAVDDSISKAKLASDEQYSAALSELYSNAVEQFLNIRENEEKRKLESYYKDKEYADKEADRKQEALQYSGKNNLDWAKLALQAGDYSYLEMLGIKPDNSQNNYSDGFGNDYSENNSSNNGNPESNSTSIKAEDAAELSRLLQYAVSLAEFGNYDLLCEITGMSKEDAALRFADKQSGYSEKQVADAAKLFMNGDYSKSVLGILKEAYPEYSYRQIWKIWESVALYEWFIDTRDGYKGP